MYYFQEVGGKEIVELGIRLEKVRNVPLLNYAHLLKESKLVKLVRDCESDYVLFTYEIEPDFMSKDILFRLKLRLLGVPFTRLY